MQNSPTPEYNHDSLFFNCLYASVTSNVFINLNIAFALLPQQPDSLLKHVELFHNAVLDVRPVELPRLRIGFLANVVREL